MKNNILFPCKEIPKGQRRLGISPSLDKNITSFFGYWQTVTTLLLMFFVISGQSYGQSNTNNSQWGKNGPASAPVSPVSWANGNAQGSNSHFKEGESIPTRIELTGLTANQSASVTFNINTIQGTNVKHAFDFFTGPNRILETVNPLQDESNLPNNLPGYGAVSYFPFPIPNAGNTGGVPAGYYDRTALKMACQQNVDTGTPSKNSIWIYNGTVTNITYVWGNEEGTSTQQTYCTVTFTPTATKALLALGCHIAGEVTVGCEGWGSGNGASAISGSPYHFHIQQICSPLNNCVGLGSQDQQMASSSVIIPPTCSVSPSSAAVCAGATATFTASGINGSGGSPYSFAWTGPGGYTATTAAITVGVAGTYSVTVRDKNGVPTEAPCTANLTVNANPTAGAGPDDSKCRTIPGPTSFTLNGTSTGGTHVWSVVPPNANVEIVDPSSLTSVVNITGDGSFTLRLTTTSNATPSCGTATDDVILNVGHRVTAGDDGSARFCKGAAGLQVINLRSLINGEDDGGVWTLQNQVVSATQNLIAADANVYTFKYTVTAAEDSGCPADDSDVVITIDQPVTAGTGSPAQYCKSDSGLASVDLRALLAGEDDGGVWTDEADAVVSSPIDLSGYAVGSHTFKYTVTPADEDSECGPDDESVTITIDSTVTAGTGSNDSYCIGDEGLASVDLRALLDGENDGGVWTDEADAVVDSPIDLSGSDAGSYTFKYTVTPAEGSECSPDDESVTITINPLPEIDCPGDQLKDVDCGVSASDAQDAADADFATWFAQFNTNNPGYVPDVSYDYEPDAAAPLSGNAPLTPLLGVPGVNPTSVTVTWTIENENGCKNSCSATFTLNYGCQIGCSTEVTNSTCFEDNNGSIKVNASGGTPPYIIYLYNSSDLVNAIADSGSLNSEPAEYTFSNLAPGDYVTESTDVVKLQGFGTRCTASVSEPGEVTLEISSTDVTCNGSANGKLSIDSHDGTGTAVISLSKDGGAFDEISEADLEAADYGPGSYEIKVCYPDGNYDADATPPRLGVCCLSKTTEISEPDELDLELTPAEATCAGNNGSISAAVTGTPLDDLEINIDGLSFADVTESPVEFEGLSATEHTIILRRKSDHDCSVTEKSTVGSENCSHIFPTQTTCCNYVTGTATGLQNVCTTIKAHKVSNAVPGVFFYYSNVIAPDVLGPNNSFTIDVKQTNDGLLNRLFTISGYPDNTNQIRLTTGNCSNVSAAVSFILSGTGAKIIVTGATAGATYVVSIKYDTKSIIGGSYSGNNTSSTYTFASYIDGSAIAAGGSTGTLNALKGCTDNTPLPGACTLDSFARTSNTIDSLDTNSDAGFDVYPVPFKDQLTIRYNFDYKTDVKIQILDVLGRVLVNYNDTDVYYNKEMTLRPEFTGHAGSMYFISLTTNRGTQTKTVISGK